GVQDERNQPRYLSPQEIIDNESALPGRVQRLPPSPRDLELGQPGLIASVNMAPISGGRVRSRSLNLSLDYRAVKSSTQSLVISLYAQRTLNAIDELLPGVSVLNARGRNSPTAWNYRGNASWTRGPWVTMGTLSSNSGREYSGLRYPAYSKLDVR